MTVYVVAALKFTDRARYDRYQAAFLPVFAKFNGAVLAADESPTPLTENFDRQKVVIMAFPDEAEAQRFLQSPEYQEISVDREAGADTMSALVHGLDG
ncbi:MAG: DUF1330 domain-containing protein [Maricaulaceae bacterium]|jgi:uncharacterized protein (DUF1330 family)